MGTIGTIVAFILIFTVVVVTHEYGHFIIAKANGIKANEFSIGMGPAIFKKQLKSTRFVIRLLPIGGACIFEGEDGNYESAEETDEIKKAKEGSMQNASVWARIATIFAGPFFNIILAYILALVICWFCGQDLPTVYSVSDGMPAQVAGLQSGDKIVKINNERIYLWREVSVISMLSSGKSMDITYERDGEIYETTLTPIYDEEADRYYIGFSGGGDYIECNNLSVFKYGWYEIRYWLKTTVRSLGYMISGRASMDDVSGPVGIATVIDDTIEETSQYGFFTVFLNMLNITVLLSVNLGVLNLLPIPALDGGRLLFLFIEAIRRKPIPQEKEGIIHFVGFVLLMVLMVIVFFNDIMKFFR